MEKMEPGKYIGKVKSYNVATNSKGNLQAVITFEVEGHGTLTYWGQFTEKSAEYTIKNLLRCGLKGTNPAGDVEIGKEVELVVDNETNENGKVYTKIKFINEIGGQQKNVVTPDIARSKLAALEGAVMKARQEMGVELSAADELGF